MFMAQKELFYIFFCSMIFLFWTYFQSEKNMHLYCTSVRYHSQTLVMCVCVCVCVLLYAPTSGDIFVFLTA